MAAHAAVRPFRTLPRALLGVLALAFALQLTAGALRAPPGASQRALPPAPPAALLELAALGEPAVLARLLMLWLQAFDYQPGISVPFRALDYARVEAWLERMLALDATFQSPLLAAARLYGEVADTARQRRMIAFVRRHYAADPARRWPWLAHAVYLARHRLDDLPLALALARELAAAPAAAPLPSWARQMHIFVLADMGELESARVLLGALIASGAVSDPRERWFLGERLAELERQRDAGALDPAPRARAHVGSADPSAEAGPASPAGAATPSSSPPPPSPSPSPRPIE
ncbi:MAG: hypothetical protein RLW62_11855 [Gammaproteobacteria bacterium]